MAHFPEAVKKISEIPKNPKYNWILESNCTASFILRNEEGVVYQIFRKGHINITGIKRAEDIEGAIFYIYSVIGISHVLHSLHQIDNIQGLLVYSFIFIHSFSLLSFLIYMYRSQLRGGPRLHES